MGAGPVSKALEPLVDEQPPQVLRADKVVVRRDALCRDLPSPNC